MDAGTGFSSQVYQLSPLFLNKDWIMGQWENNYYISAIAGANNGSSLVVMSKGTQFLQQSYKVRNRWAIVMSRGAGFSDQVVELDFLYPSEGIHKRWDAGYRITSTAVTLDQMAFVLSIPRRKPADETQEHFAHPHFLAHMLRKNGQGICILPLCVMVKPSHEQSQFSLDLNLSLEHLSNQTIIHFYFEAKVNLFAK
ncbi:hypothetical protein L1987_09205 [Smallanthus sonchifolius]|uniref:Uncharacterized protein n=1 Tax=Smallanthus sonchifolius TaxID=185202 RepID=A0ACB9JP87_9ASTR|nr:hypothetical protein L1987_09205 [Smallanthus sonchifolius]